MFEPRLLMNNFPFLRIGIEEDLVTIAVLKQTSRVTGQVGLVSGKLANGNIVLLEKADGEALL